MPKKLQRFQFSWHYADGSRNNMKGTYILTFILHSYRFCCPSLGSGLPVGFWDRFQPLGTHCIILHNTWPYLMTAFSLRGSRCLTQVAWSLTKLGPSTGLMAELYIPDFFLSFSQVNRAGQYLAPMQWALVLPWVLLQVWILWAAIYCAARH